MILKRITQEELNEILDKHERWFDNKPGGEQADLSNKNLSNLDISDRQLHFINFNNSDLSYSKLLRSRFDYANFENCKLKCCNMKMTKFTESILTGTDLSYSSLESAEFISCRMYDISLDKSYLYKLNIIDCVTNDLLQVKNKGIFTEEILYFYKKDRLVAGYFDGNLEEFKATIVDDAGKECELIIELFEKYKENFYKPGYLITRTV